ncbi:MAG: hypothetical protein IE933_04270 [Sphingomonadales bacterium]|nr:hypothetical protein [Sphingomonadales bacterium]MBD3772834.1 hypothetical protein [Paracoccaceae bacterium]
MTQYLKIIAAYAMVGIAGFAIYIASFRVPLGIDILFYRGLALAGLTAVLLAVAIFAARRWIRLDPATAIGAIFTATAFNICFLVLFPVTVDRSISVFLLARIEAEEPITTAQLQDRFTTEYLGQMEQIPRRVREQSQSGNLIEDANGRITLTKRGRAFNRFARLASDWFDTDRRFVTPNAAPAPGEAGQQR